MSEYDVVLNTRPNSWRLKSIYSMEYTCGMTDVNEIKKFLTKYGSDSDASKVYVNDNKCVGIMATNMMTGDIELTRLTTARSNWIVVYRYKDGGHDIFVLSDPMWRKLFRRSRS